MREGYEGSPILPLYFFGGKFYIPIVHFESNADLFKNSSDGNKYLNIPGGHRPWK